MLCVCMLWAKQREQLRQFLFWHIFQHHGQRAEVSSGWTNSENIKRCIQLHARFYSVARGVQNSKTANLVNVLSFQILRRLISVFNNMIESIHNQKKHLQSQALFLQAVGHLFNASKQKCFYNPLTKIMEEKQVHTLTRTCSLMRILDLLVCFLLTDK